MAGTRRCGPQALFGKSRVDMQLNTLRCLVGVPRFFRCSSRSVYGCFFFDSADLPPRLLLFLLGNVHFPQVLMPFACAYVDLACV